MFLSGFGRFLTDSVKGNSLSSRYCKISYKIISLCLVTSLLAVNAGCNLTVHRADGRGETLLEPVSAPVVVPEAQLENSQKADPDGATVAEGQGEFSPSDSQPVAEAEVAETEGGQLEQDSEKSEASGGEVIITVNPDVPKGTEQIPSGVSAVNPTEEVGSVVNVSGKVVEVRSIQPRAVLASLKIPGGAKLSPLPVRLEDGSEGASGLLGGDNGPEPPVVEVEPEPESVIDSTELTSAVNTANSPAQDDKEKEGKESTADSEKKPEDKPSGAAGDDSSGDDKGASDGDDKQEAAKDGEKSKSRFPYGIVLVLAACLGIAIFQNTAGKSI